MLDIALLQSTVNYRLYRCGTSINIRYDGDNCYSICLNVGDNRSYLKTIHCESDDPREFLRQYILILDEALKNAQRLELRGTALLKLQHVVNASQDLLWAMGGGIVENPLDDSVSKRYQESLAKTPGPAQVDTSNIESVDLRGISEYAKAKGVPAAELSKEEINRFIILKSND